MKDNVVLIGMPGSGKSAVGKKLAELTGLKHTDADRLIEAHENMLLQEIIDLKGLDYFADLEERVLSELDCKGYIISPGGSVCYYPGALEHLSQIADIVYLKSDIESLYKHIPNMYTRGITFKPGQTFEDLYEERCPLYEKYAEITVISDMRPVDEIAEELAEKLR